MIGPQGELISKVIFYVLKGNPNLIKKKEFIN
jgi:hypothetical protein